MVHAKLDLLGGFHLAAAGTELRLPTRKAAALLACLALAPERARSRETLIGLLWGERGETQARHSLSQTLSSIRRVFADAGAAPIVVADVGGIALESGRVEVDVDGFERRVAEGTPEALREAATLYRGDLLEGLRLREEAFEEWLAGERNRLRERALGVFSVLLEQLVAADRTDDAVQVAVRLLALDPLQESAHRELMRLYVLQGRPASALRQYELCARTLRAELGVEPEAETTELYAEIRRQRQARARAAPDRAESARPEAWRSDEAQVGRRSRSGRPSVGTGVTDEGERAAGLAVALRPDRAAPLSKTRSAILSFGREAELRRLHVCLENALAGTRRVVFVTGEAGLGKTTLIEAFLDELENDGTTLRIGQGQCLEQRGPGEAYMPVLEALGRLCRARGGRELIDLLAAQAPTWLAQMPGLLDAAASEALGRRTRGATRERMLREMVEAIEAMSAERPLILILEDLHWSDASTADLLARLIRRTEAARLLLIGTYRPADVRANGHPLQAIDREVCLRACCEELKLAALSRSDADAYLAARFPGAALPAGLGGRVHQRTDGNPLFMAALATSWIAEGLLVPDHGGWSLWAGPEELTAGVPATLAQLIEQQVERLDPADREIVEAASIAGREFSAAMVAAAAGRDEDDTEARFAALARQGRLVHARGIAEWPDGTVASRYGFIHDLYQEVLYERVPAGRRARLHHRCGARLETAYGLRARERAAEFAAHFLSGRDFERAIGYLQAAAEQAFQRSAHPEAVGHLHAALDALRHLPDEGGHAAWELALQTRLGEILTVTEGWSSIDAERAFLRAQELCRQMADQPPEFPRVLYGLANLYEFRGDFDTSGALIEQRLKLPADDDDAFLQAQELLTCSLYHRGWFERALDEAARALGRCGPARPTASRVAAEMALHLNAWAALALWFLGRPDQAVARALEIVEVARGLESPAAPALAHAKGAIVHQLRRDAPATEAWATTALRISTEQGFRYRAATASILRGWALAAQGGPDEGVALLREGLSACRDTGAEMDRPYYLALLAEACGHAGRIAEGLDAMREGLAIVQEARGGQPFFYEAELHRLCGVLRVRQGGPNAADEAEASLRRALDVARRQDSSSLELRAALDLVRLGRASDALSLLEATYERFSEGFDTPDLLEAKALLEE